MDDLISRAAAIETVRKAKDKSETHRMLIQLPSVDAVPASHGEWVWVQYDANPEIGNFHCSKCRFIPATFNMINKQLNFCPNCGAKMDWKDGNNG